MTVQSRSFDIAGAGARWAEAIAQVLLGAYLIAVSAHVRVVLPVSPVPITGQTLVVLLLGALLGAHRGLLSVGLYLAGGAVGVPLFAGGSLAGPTGGYLAGFAAAAVLTGRLMAAGWGARPLTAITALLLGNAAIYLFGLPWLARFVGWDAVLPMGLFPFLVGDGLKLGCAACVWVAFKEHR